MDDPARRRRRAALWFLLVLLAAGRLSLWLRRDRPPENLPPAHHGVVMVDATSSPVGCTLLFPEGGKAAELFSLVKLPSMEGEKEKPLPRGSVLEEGEGGRWRLRPMNEREKWVWGLPMDANRVGVEDLLRIPGIGPALARRIKDRLGAAPVRSLGELASVPGIGPGRLSALADALEAAPAGTVR